MPAGSGGLNYPYSLIFGPDGNLYVSNRLTSQISRYDGQTGTFIDAFVPAGSGGLVDPTGLVFGPDGNLYVSSASQIFAGSEQVLRYDGKTGAFIDAFVPAGSGGLVDPVSLVFGPDSNLYVSSFATRQVLRYNGKTGAFIDAFVPAGSGGLVRPTGLVFGPDSNLYVSGRDNNAVLRYNGQTGVFIDAFVPPGSGGLYGPHDLAFGPDGNLYVSSEFSKQILRYDGKTGAFIDAFVPAGSGVLNGSTGLAFTPTTDDDWVREAEDCELYGAFQSMNDPTASGGSFVQVPNGVGTRDLPDEAQKMVCRLSVPSGGTYRIKGVVRAPSPSYANNSFFVKVDGAPGAGYLWDIPESTRWATDEVSDRNGADPVGVTLAAGAHTVTIYLREDGAQIDKIRLEPTGTPPSNLAREAEACDIYGAFEIVADATASGGSFVAVPDYGGVWGSPNEAHKVVCQFSVPDSGAYRIKGLVRAPSPAYGNNSFYVKIDGVPSAGYLWDTPESTRWIADAVSDRNGADPVEVSLSAGTHNVTIYLREDGTQLDKIELEPIGAMPGDLASEAEDCELSGAFQIAADPTASEGSYVHAPNGAGTRDLPDEAQKMLCEFSVAKAGTYRIKGLVRAPSPSYANNSFFVKVDGAPGAGYLWDLPESTLWITDEVSDRNGADPVQVSLAAGPHTVAIYLREDGAQIDRIELEPVD